MERVGDRPHKRLEAVVPVEAHLPWPPTRLQTGSARDLLGGRRIVRKLALTGIGGALGRCQLGHFSIGVHDAPELGIDEGHAGNPESEPHLGISPAYRFRAVVRDSDAVFARWMNGHAERV